ncbi:hypothetical protein GGI25_003313 [Coemansia spiralis]|uniref:Uncharacterized protein n=2 Tax=Coemansia TaxID=4863 RepID=A0A9W8KWM9_9FUNG|nr:hypothetical protein BX070DRAFT_233539 [Coemansia spiralis]KAJ1992799.1 hypothetical protein EDC05_002583 [Coemansia umbellata]KAJ2622543.1 hypothetical protein GGI26_003142 [Coemansia sp. RSA 1358]KAJ2677093.1 hypothetical protein GGI25_003313 [Coemansia spiralis]
MYRSNDYLGPYHRCLPIPNNQQKEDAMDERLEPLESVTPLTPAPKTIRVYHDGHHGMECKAKPKLPSISNTVHGYPNNDAPASLLARLPSHSHSYRSHYQQPAFYSSNAPLPPLPQLTSSTSTTSLSSSPLQLKHREGFLQVRAPSEGRHQLAHGSGSSSSLSPPSDNISHKRPHDMVAQEAGAARKRSRHAWPAKMTRQIINVLLDEFLIDAAFRTTIYRSRDERDHRFLPSGRSILEEYNKVQNMRRRYFIPLSYLLQWDQLRTTTPGMESMRSRQRATIEKKLAKPLERSRLQMIFCSAVKGAEMDMVEEEEIEESADIGANGKPMFELDIFVTELKRRDIHLWSRAVAAFQAWVSRKCSINFIIN